VSGVVNRKKNLKINLFLPAGYPVDDQQQDNGAYESRKNLAEEAANAQVQQTEKPTAQERANYAYNHVADHAERVSDDFVSQEPRHQTN
jgi:hypothetical protein